MKVSPVTRAIRSLEEGVSLHRRAVYQRRTIPKSALRGPPKNTLDVQGDVREVYGRLLQWTLMRGVNVIRAPVLKGYGVFLRHKNQIVVDPYLTDAQAFKTLVHEVAHSILHVRGKFTKEERHAQNEIEAETVAFVVCSVLEVPMGSYSFRYINTWAQGRVRLDTRRVRHVTHLILKWIA